MVYKKNFIIFILSILFWSCENIPDGVIEPINVDYSVVDINAPDQVIYSESNILSTSITIKNTSTIENVWFNIRSFDDTEQITSLILMISNKINGDKTYTGEFEINQNLLPGDYILNYYVEDNIRIDTENLRKVASKKFQFQIEKENFPPVLSNLSAPLSVTVGANFLLEVKVIDPNGPEDIEEVNFEIFDSQEKKILSDSTNGITKFKMFDDGKSGDKISKDGIYSANFAFNKNIDLGAWKFIFYSVDSDNSISDTIETEITATKNIPPVLSDLSVPLFVTVGGNFLLQLKVIDPNGPEDIKEVNFEIFDSQGNKVLSDSTNGTSTFKMFDDGKSGDKISKDGIYSANFAFNKNSDLDTWKFIFYAVDIENSISDTLETEITTTENFAPVISNLDMPQEVERDAFFPFSILVEDPNGLSNIDSVYYQLFDPSGNLIRNSENISKFPMFDDGDININGDETAEDGTYTVVLRFPETVATGDWEFRFNAVDKAGQLSNIITNILKVN